MTELSKQAQKILDDGAQAGLPARSVADANWAALTTRIAAGAPAPAIAPAKFGLVAKILGVGVAVLGGAALAGAVLRAPADAPREPRSERRAVAAAPATLPAPVISAPTIPTPATPAIVRADATRPARPGPKRSRPTGKITDVDVDDLAEEERLVSAARRDLERDPDAALARIAEYQRRFPAGVLAQEAAATRILALCQSDRRAEGTRLLAEFTRRWPDAPALARVRRTCQQPDAR